MSKTFEVLALITKKEYVMVKAKDGYEALERVDTNEENIFDKSIMRIDARSAVEVVKDD
tara:strand:+ start:233 stop:409 length:177 start_codon:yes stop_codon:yes gene_type:complete